jgi:hypothetical protein
VDRELDLDLPDGLLRTPRLAPQTSGWLHLFWVARASGSSDWELWYAGLTREGEIQREPLRLSEEGQRVGDYTFTVEQDGRVAVIWDLGDTGGLVGQRISTDGIVQGRPVQITPTGEAPAVRVDSDGRLHMAWLEGANIHYVAFPGMELTPAEGDLIETIPLGTGSTLAGFTLGLSTERVYVVWSVLNQSGLESGTARTRYISFPLDDPGAITGPNLIWLSPAEEPPYRSYQGSYALTELADPVLASVSTEFIFQPTTVQAQREELAVAVAANQQYRLDNHLQIAVLILDDGEFEGYAFSAKTTSLSEQPILVGDEVGNLHLAWREGSAGQFLYYATTSPSARAELDRLNATDFINAVLVGSLEGLTSIFLFPVIGIGWLLPGAIVLGVRKLFREREKLTDAGSIAALVFAVGLYQFVKVISLPAVLMYVPFSAWLEIPPGWALPLRLLVPAAILAIAVFVAEKVRARHPSSTMYYYFGLVAADALLTLSVYGVNFLGVT